VSGPSPARQAAGQAGERCYGSSFCCIRIYGGLLRVLVCLETVHGRYIDFAGDALQAKGFKNSPEAIGRGRILEDVKFAAIGPFSL
jgi:hypothetical protein